MSDERLRLHWSIWLREESLSALLVLLLLAGFVLPPLTPWVGVGARDVAFSLVLITGVATVSRSRSALAISGLLVAVSLGLSWSGLAARSATARSLDLAVTLVCACLFALLVLGRALSPGPVTRHRIQGAVAAYLLIGLACAIAFELLAHLDPGALRGLAAVELRDLRRELGYFSLVTLTTVGYGDITAVSEGARTLATFEALVGQLYPAIILGSMISGLSLRKS